MYTWTQTTNYQLVVTFTATTATAMGQLMDQILPMVDAAFDNAEAQLTGNPVSGVTISLTEVPVGQTVAPTQIVSGRS